MQDPIAELESIRNACVEYFGEYASKMILSKPRADIRLRVIDNLFPRSVNGSHVTMCFIQRGSIEWDDTRTPAKFIIVVGNDQKITEIRNHAHIKEILNAEFNLKDVQQECDKISAPVEKGFEEQAQILANIIFRSAMREFAQDLQRFDEYTSMKDSEKHEFRSRLIKNVLTPSGDTSAKSPNSPMALTQEWVAIDRLSTILSNLTR